MASYTTPRTASIADIFTAAWYNAELRDNIEFLHDVLVGAGSSFPGSPVAGQSFTLVVGNTRKRFTSDGTHWYSDETAVPFPSDQFVFGATNTALTVVTQQPVVDIHDAVHTTGCTLQGRLVAAVHRASGGGSASGTFGLSTATATSGAAFGSAAFVSGTEVTVTGAGGVVIAANGPWGDLTSGSIDVVSLGAYGRAGDGTTEYTLDTATAYLRFKL